LFGGSRGQRVRRRLAVRCYSTEDKTGQDNECRRAQVYPLCPHLHTIMRAGTVSLADVRRPWRRSRGTRRSVSPPQGRGQGMQGRAGHGALHDHARPLRLPVLHEGGSDDNDDAPGAPTAQGAPECARRGPRNHVITTRRASKQNLQKFGKFSWQYASARRLTSLVSKNVEIRTCSKGRFVLVTNKNKKLSYRRGTARCVVSVEILPNATQQSRY